MLVPILVKERLYIPRAPEFEDMLSELRSEFTYANPTFGKMKAMNKWTGNTPPQIQTWKHVDHEEWNDCITLPRGGTNKVRKIFENYGLTPRFVDQRLSLPPITNLYNDVTLRPDQQRLAEVMFKRENCLIRSPTASGKCLAPDTKVLMYDGSIRRADQISQGDYLMGPDSRPRLVRTTTSGYGPMFKITPIKGDPWYCNDKHVLTLVHTSSNKIIDIPISEYLESSNTFKHLHKQFMVGVDFPIIDDLPIDPYFIGIWLGDGRKDLRFIEITKPDPEIKHAMEMTANEWELIINSYKHPDRCISHRIVSPVRQNELLTKLRQLMCDGIRIPKSYLCHTTRESRLELLAGLIDTDGHQAGGYFEIVQKQSLLADDIQYLSHSLGFRTTRKIKIVNEDIYQRINILGDVSIIPTRIPRKQAPTRKMNKDARRVGFTAESIGNGDYTGWTLDGDGRFLLGDFTVTHNTETALKVTEWILKTSGPVIILVWESELLQQWVERIMLRFGLRESDVGILSGKKKRVAPITVAMQQTLMRNGFKYTRLFGGFIADEVQRFAAPTYQNVVDIFPAKYRIGISADERRRDNKQFLIYDAFGNVADEIDKAQLIDAGKIHDVTIRMIPTQFDYHVELNEEDVPWIHIPSDLKNYNDFLDIIIDDENRNNLIWEFMEPTLRADRTLLVVTRRRKHAMYWEARIRAAGYSSGLILGQDTTEFKRTVDGLRRGTVQAGVGTIQKGGTGHDIPRLDRAFILAPLINNEQLFEQVIGRIRRPHEGKNDAVCYYFWDRYCYPKSKNKMVNLYPGNTYVWMDDEFLPAS